MPNKESEWHFVGKSSDFQEGKPLRRDVMTLKIVIIRKMGQLKAFDDRCPHRGFSLSANCKKLKDDTLFQCSYHGWRFDNNGTLIERPGFIEERPLSYKLPSYEVTEQGGLVFVSTDKEASVVPQALLDLSDNNFDPINVIQDLKASSLHVVENLLDPFHTHYVHTSFLRTGPLRVKVDVEVDYDQGSSTLQLSYLNEPTPSGWVSKLFERKRVKTVGKYHHPNITVLEYWTEHGIDLRVTMALNEVSDKRCLGVLVFQVARRGLPFALKKPFFRFFINSLVRQDKVFLEELQTNLDSFQKRNYWQGKEDSVLSTILQLRAGNRPESFKKDYSIML